MQKQLSDEEVKEHLETFHIGQNEGHVSAMGFDEYMKHLGFVKIEGKYYHE